MLLPESFFLHATCISQPCTSSTAFKPPFSHIHANWVRGCMLGSFVHAGPCPDPARRPPPVPTSTPWTSFLCGCRPCPGCSASHSRVPCAQAVCTRSRKPKPVRRCLSACVCWCPLPRTAARAAATRVATSLTSSINTRYAAVAAGAARRTPPLQDAGAGAGWLLRLRSRTPQRPRRRAGGELAAGQTTPRPCERQGVGPTCDAERPLRART